LGKLVNCSGYSENPAFSVSSDFAESMGAASGQAADLLT
jgi:hypothetical protein